MPTVYKRQVGTAAIPGVRLTAAETAISQGAGVAQARGRKFGEVAQLGAGLAQQGLELVGRQQAEKKDAIEKAKRQADQVAVMAGDNRISEWLRINVYDSKSGALTKQGPASFELPEKLAAEFDKLTSEIERGLGNEEQRIAFEPIRSNRREALDHTLHAHVSRERQTYAANELKANTENAIDLVIANAHAPYIAKAVLTGAEQYITAIGPSLGMGTEELKTAIADLRGRAIGGTVKRLTDSGHTAAAREYFNTYQTIIPGTEVGDIETALKLGERKKKAQESAKAITSVPGSTPDQWRTKAKAITDADEQEDVLRLVEHEAAFYDRQQRDIDEKRMRRAGDVIRSTGSMSGIPTSDLALMEEDQIRSLEAYTKAKAAGVPIKTKFEVYNSLMEMAGDDPDSFLAVNLDDYVDVVSEADLEKLATVKKSIKDGNRRAADAAIEPFFTNQQVANEILSGAGFDPTPEPGSDQVEPVRKFREELSRAVDALTVATGKKPTNEDVRAIGNTLYRKVVIEGSRSWLTLGYDVEQALIDLPAADRIGRMTLADMPPSLRTLSEESLRRYGQAVTDQAVLADFRRYLLANLPKVPPSGPAPSTPVTTGGRGAGAGASRGVTTDRGGRGAGPGP